MVLTLLCIAFSACVPFRDPDVSAYLKYKAADAGHGDFSSLPDDEKTKVFFGAMKVHPPFLSIEDELVKQDLAYLLQLKIVIEDRGGSYEAYSFIAAIAQKQRNGQLSRQQVGAMHLDRFCNERGDVNNLCRNLLMELSGELTGQRNRNGLQR
jgi:hypothetical protein